MGRRNTTYRNEEWGDGTLLTAMKNGDYLLLDELNLAEPQILERLNSILDQGVFVVTEHNNETYLRHDLFDNLSATLVEPGKKVDSDGNVFYRIHENFRMIAASNPVDLRNQGRVRLSLAFRNRFREIWTDEIKNSEELTEIAAYILGGDHNPRFTRTDTPPKAPESDDSLRNATSTPAIDTAKIEGHMNDETIQNGRTEFQMFLEFAKPIGDDELKNYVSKDLDISQLSAQDIEKIRQFIQRVKAMVKTVGGDFKMDIVAGKGWTIVELEDGRHVVTFPLGDILTRDINSNLGAALHEGGERDIGRVIDKFWFTKESLRALYNVVNDPRVNTYEEAKWLGASAFLSYVYDEAWPKVDTTQPISYYNDYSTLPHIQFCNAIIYYHRHGEISPMIQNRAVLEALNKTLDHIKEAYSQHPPTLNPSELEKREAAERMESIMRNKILPEYEKLIRESAKKVEDGLQNGQIQLRPDEPGPRTLSPDELTKKAQDIIDAQSRKIADKLQGKIPRPDLTKMREEIARDKEIEALKKQLKEKLGGEIQTLKDLMDRKILQDRLRDAQKSEWDKYQAPGAQLINTLIGLLENELTKEERPKYEGYYRTGRKIDWRRYLQYIASGYDPQHEKFWMRRTLPQKPSISFTFVLDESISMLANNKDVNALQSLVLFVEVLNHFGIDFNIVGFAEAPSVHKDFDKDITSANKDDFIREVASFIGSGWTDLASGVELGVDKMINESNTEHKVVIVLTDGEGNTGKSEGTYVDAAGRFNDPALADVLKKADRNAIDVLGVGIGEGIKCVPDLFSKFIVEKVIENLPYAFTDILIDKILNAPMVESNVNGEQPIIPQSGQTQSGQNQALSFFELFKEAEPYKDFDEFAPYEIAKILHGMLDKDSLSEEEVSFIKSCMIKFKISDMYRKALLTHDKTRRNDLIKMLINQAGLLAHTEVAEAIADCFGEESVLTLQREYPDVFKQLIATTVAEYQTVDGKAKITRIILENNIPIEVPSSPASNLLDIIQLDIIQKEIVLNRILANWFIDNTPELQAMGEDRLQHVKLTVESFFNLMKGEANGGFDALYERLAVTEDKATYFTKLQAIKDKEGANLATQILQDISIDIDVAKVADIIRYHTYMSDFGVYSSPDVLLGMDQTLLDSLAVMNAMDAAGKVDGNNLSTAIIDTFLGLSDKVNTDPGTLQYYNTANNFYTLRMNNALQAIDYANTDSGHIAATYAAIDNVFAGAVSGERTAFETNWQSRISVTPWPLFQKLRNSSAERFAKFTKLMSQITNKYLLANPGYTQVSFDMDVDFYNMSDIERANYIHLLETALDAIPLASSESEVEGELAASNWSSVSVFGIPIKLKDGKLILKVPDAFVALIADAGTSAEDRTAAVGALKAIDLTGWSEPNFFVTAGQSFFNLYEGGVHSDKEYVVAGEVVIINYEHANISKDSEFTTIQSTDAGDGKINLMVNHPTHGITTQNNVIPLETKIKVGTDYYLAYIDSNNVTHLLGYRDINADLAEGLAKSFFEMKKREDAAKGTDYIDDLKKALTGVDNKYNSSEEIKTDLASLARDIYLGNDISANPLKDIFEIQLFFEDLGNFINFIRNRGFLCDPDIPTNFIAFGPGASAAIAEYNAWYAQNQSAGYAEKETQLVQVCKALPQEEKWLKGAVFYRTVLHDASASLQLAASLLVSFQSLPDINSVLQTLEESSKTKIYLNSLGISRFSELSQKQIYRVLINIIIDFELENEDRFLLLEAYDFTAEHVNPLADIITAELGDTADSRAVVQIAAQALKIIAQYEPHGDYEVRYVSPDTLAEIKNAFAFLGFPYKLLAVNHKPGVTFADNDAEQDIKTFIENQYQNGNWMFSVHGPDGKYNKFHHDSTATTITYETNMDLKFIYHAQLDSHFEPTDLGDLDKTPGAAAALHQIMQNEPEGFVTEFTQAGVTYKITQEEETGDVIVCVLDATGEIVSAKIYPGAKGYAGEPYDVNKVKFAALGRNIKLSTAELLAQKEEVVNPTLIDNLRSFGGNIPSLLDTLTKPEAEGGKGFEIKFFTGVNALAFIDEDTNTVWFNEWLVEANQAHAPPGMEVILQGLLTHEAKHDSITKTLFEEWEEEIEAVTAEIEVYAAAIRADSTIKDRIIALLDARFSLNNIIADDLLELASKSYYKADVAEFVTTHYDEFKPFRYEILHPVYVGRMVAECNVVTPNHEKGKRAVYNGSGGGISDYLLTTDATEGDFVDELPVVEANLRTALADWDNVGTTQEDKRYIDFKRANGYAHPFRLDAIGIERAIILELKYIDTKRPEREDIKLTPEGWTQIEFKWTYPGTTQEKTYTITFKEKLEDALKDKIDIYYQRAAAHIPQDYPSFMPDVGKAITTGGYCITDDYRSNYHYYNPETYLQEISPDGGGAQFTKDEELRSSSMLTFENTIVSGLKSTPYGWHVRIRQKLYNTETDNKDRIQKVYTDDGTVWEEYQKDGSVKLFNPVTRKNIIIRFEYIYDADLNQEVWWIGEEDGHGGFNTIGEFRARFDQPDSITQYKIVIASNYRDQGIAKTVKRWLGHNDYREDKRLRVSKSDNPRAAYLNSQLFDYSDLILTRGNWLDQGGDKVPDVSESNINKILLEAEYTFANSNDDTTIAKVVNADTQEIITNLPLGYTAYIRDNHLVVADEHGTPQDISYTKAYYLYWDGKVDAARVARDQMNDSLAVKLKKDEIDTAEARVDTARILARADTPKARASLSEYAKRIYNALYNKAAKMVLSMNPDIEEAGITFACEIMKGMQEWMVKLDPLDDIIINFCTGDTPWLGYEKMAYFLDNWNNPAVQAILRAHGVDTSVKPDMGRVVAYPLDAMFPQKRTDYHSFKNKLDNVWEKLHIDPDNRHFFYGDLIERKDGTKELDKMSDTEFDALMADIDANGLRFGDYKAGTIPHDNIQYKFLRAMEQHALDMSREIETLGGAHIFLSGIGPSYAGKGHVGFMESGTPFGQAAFIGSIGRHIAAGHSAEVGSLGELYLGDNAANLSKYGFTTFGWHELLYRQGNPDPSDDVKVIAIATGNAKYNSVYRGIEGDYDPTYPVSGLQNSRGVFVVDANSAASLRIKTNPWEFYVVPEWSDSQVKEFFTQLSEDVSKIKGRDVKISELTENDFLDLPTNGSQDMQIIKEFNLFTLKEKNTWETLRNRIAADIESALTNPEDFDTKLGLEPNSKDTILSAHLDDDFFAMKDSIEELVKKGHEVSVHYLTTGHHAVDDHYVINLLNYIREWDETKLAQYAGLDEETLTGQLVDLIKDQNLHQNPTDYDVWTPMSGDEKRLRAQLLLINMNRSLGDIFTDKSKSDATIDFLISTLQNKGIWDNKDTELMEDVKTFMRTTEAKSALMSLGVAFENIHVPSNVVPYSSEGRGPTAGRSHIEAIKYILRSDNPDLIISNGEGFPDYGTHSTVEAATATAILELINEGVLDPTAVKYLQYAGVWYRNTTAESQLSVVISPERLAAFDRQSRQHYPSQSPPPQADSGYDIPVHFSEQVALNAIATRGEIARLIGTTGPWGSVLSDMNAGVLNYKVIDLADREALRRLNKKAQELNKVRAVLKQSSNIALNGPAPLPDIASLTAEIVALEAAGISLSEVLNLKLFTEQLYYAKRPEHRAAAARVLGMIGTPVAVQILTSFLSDDETNPTVIVAVVQALGSSDAAVAQAFGSPDAIQFLFDRLKTETNFAVNEGIVVALDTVGTEDGIAHNPDIYYDRDIVQNLANLLTSTDSAVREAAGRLLGAIQSVIALQKRSVQLTIDAGEDLSAELTGLLQKEYNIVNKILPSLDSAKPLDERIGAAYALGMAGNKLAVQPLVDIISDNAENADLKEAAALALESIPIVYEGTDSVFYVPVSFFTNLAGTQFGGDRKLKATDRSYVFRGGALFVLDSLKGTQEAEGLIAHETGHIVFNYQLDIALQQALTSSEPNKMIRMNTKDPFGLIDFFSISFDEDPDGIIPQEIYYKPDGSVDIHHDVYAILSAQEIKDIRRALLEVVDPVNYQSTWTDPQVNDALKVIFGTEVEPGSGEYAGHEIRIVGELMEIWNECEVNSPASSSALETLYNLINAAKTQIEVLPATGPINYKTFITELGLDNPMFYAVGLSPRFADRALAANGLTDPVISTTGVTADENNKIRKNLMEAFSGAEKIMVIGPVNNMQIDIDGIKFTVSSLRKQVIVDAYNVAHENVINRRAANIVLGIITGITVLGGGAAVLDWIFDTEPVEPMPNDTLDIIYHVHSAPEDFAYHEEYLEGRIASAREAKKEVKCVLEMGKLTDNPYDALSVQWIRKYRQNREQARKEFRELIESREARVNEYIFNRDMHEDSIVKIADRGTAQEAKIKFLRKHKIKAEFEKLDLDTYILNILASETPKSMG
ncbi:MAG: HEAT repeat domain-containing protein [Planctomycetota bacterium]